MDEIACVSCCFALIFVVSGILPRNRLAALKARQATHTIRAQNWVFLHAPPGG